MNDLATEDREHVGTCSHCEEPVYADQDHKAWDGPFDPEHQECRDLWNRWPTRRDMLPLLEDPRYLDREPECVEGAIAVADSSETTFFIEGVTAYFGPDRDEILHSWTDTFCRNVRRRARSLTIELRKQRDDDQPGLDDWSE